MVAKKSFEGSTEYFLAAAAGVFLYLGTVHLLGEASFDMSKAMKLFSFTAGFGLMSLLAIWA